MPLDRFSMNWRNGEYRWPKCYCKACCVDRTRAWQRKNRDRYLAYLKAYMKRYREKERKDDKDVHDLQGTK